MEIIFDRDQPTERSLVLDRINERPAELILSGSYDRVVGSTEEFQDVSDFVNNKTFTTVHVITEDGSILPLCSGYNTISELMTTYSERNKTYSLTLAVIKQDTET